MVKAPVYTISGTKSGEFTLPRGIFEVKPNLSLLAQAIYVYEMRAHVGLRKTKTRSEVNRTTKKLYSQKGTGGARHGSKRAPIFVGGGIAFGPRPVKRELNLSQVQKKAAKSSAFSLKAHDKQIVVVSGISKLGKTKEAADFLKKIAKAVEAKSFTFVISDDSKVARFLRNIKNVSVVSFAKANALDIWTGGTLIIDKDAFSEKTKPVAKELERGGKGRRGTRSASSEK